MSDSVTGSERAREDTYGVKIAGAGLSLALLMMMARTRLIHFRYLPSFLARGAAQILAAYSDLLYVALITGGFLVLLLIAGRRPRVRRALYGGFVAVSILSLLAALANIKIVSILGRPLNYQWLYYSDFLRSQDARNAVFAELSWNLLLFAVAVLLTFSALARLFSLALMRLRRAFGSCALVLTATVGLAIYFGLSAIVLARRSWDTTKMENPVISFARSVVIARRSPLLLTMKTSVGATDFEPARGTRSRSAAAHAGGARIRNVLVVVLESIPAKYLEAYGGRYPVTPELTRSLGRSELFENIYAHCPTTSFSLVSLLMSAYTGLSFESLTEQRPDIPFPSLSSELKRRGYRTAFFNSSDLRHQHCEAFLSDREFETVRDYRGFPCRKPLLRASTKNWPFLDGVDDECTADALVDWIRSEPERPYFAVLWTMMTHYPYFSGSDVANFGVDEKFNRYLNGLRHDDQVVGNILNALQQNGLDRSTLVVILGDHGESFGQHGFWTHAQNLYEESVHVPLILINPELFHGERSAVIGGLIDVAPTILDLLDIAPPEPWQGRSLFSHARTGRTYFFAPWADQLFGLREANLKVIYDASDNHFEVYDLARDPNETINRAPQMRSAVEIGQQRLAAWVQYQHHMMKEMLPERAR